MKEEINALICRSEVCEQVLYGLCSKREYAFALSLALFIPISVRMSSMEWTEAETLEVVWRVGRRVAIVEIGPNTATAYIQLGDSEHGIEDMAYTEFRRELFSVMGELFRFRNMEERMLHIDSIEW